MKKALTAVCIAALALAILAVAGILLYRHFVTDRITDGGDMTNPFLTQQDVSPLLPENCAFVSLSWFQNAMNYDDCYSFHLSGGPDAPVIACSFADESSSARARLELGEDDLNPVPISRESWIQAERMLREMSLPVYQAPAPDLSDAAVNQISISRVEESGTVCSSAFDGTDAAPLLALLKEIAREAAPEK